MTLLSHLAPGLATRLAARLFITPIPTRQPRRELAWAEGAERTSLPSPVGPIPVWIWGDGPGAVILAHGWSGRGLQLGAFVEPLVASGYRVVTYDAPAHGEAPGRTSSMPAFAAALGAVARRFGPIAAVVSHSIGATATIYALAFDELAVQRIVAIAPAGRLAEVRRRYGKMTGFPETIIERMKTHFEHRLGIDWESSEPLSIAPGQGVRLLVIHDSGDSFIPQSESAELADAWPDGRLVITDGLGHHRILRDPGVIDSAVSFITEADTEAQIGIRDTKRRAS